MQKKIFILIKLCLLIGAAQTMAVGASLKAVIYTEEWPPLNYGGSNGEVRGLATDRVKALVEATGISYDIQLVSWYRAYHLTLKTPNTMLYTILKTPEREDLFHWYCPIAESQQISLFRLTSRNDIKLNELQDAKRLVLGVTRGDYVGEFLLSKGFNSNKNLVFTADADVNLQQLLNGRIDLIAESKAALNYRLTELGIATDTVTEALGSIDGITQKACLAINKESDTELIELLDKSFARLKPL